MADRRAPGWLRQIPAVDVLRRVWIQRYTIGANGREVIWRDAQQHGFPPGRTRIISPYDIDARHSAKRGTLCTGYKVHLSETCDNTPDEDGRTIPTLPPNLITNVVTTHAAVADQIMAIPVHHQLADRDLLPDVHLMDAGYCTTASLLTCRNDQVRLVAPHRRDSSRHTRTGSPYARDKFTIDFDQRQAICPQGHRSATWNPGHHDGHDVITVGFPLGARIVCPARRSAPPPSNAAG